MAKYKATSISRTPQEIELEAQIKAKIPSVRIIDIYRKGLSSFADELGLQKST